MLSDFPMDIGKETVFAFLEQSSRHWSTRGSSSSACEVAVPVNRLYPGHCRLESCQTCCRIAVDKHQSGCFYDGVIYDSSSASYTLKKGK